MRTRSPLPRLRLHPLSFLRHGPGIGLGLLSCLAPLAPAPVRAAPRADAAPPYPFAELPRPETDSGPPQPGDDLEHRFAPPAGAARVPVPPGSFGAWLRRLPLLPAGAAVHLYDGRLKPVQDVHAAVVALNTSVGGRPRDLQQCADAVMRLRAEYLFAARPGGPATPIQFHPQPGKPAALVFRGSTRPELDRYLIHVFAEAGSASLQAELARAEGPVQPGDVLIQGGYPGHAVIVLDVAARADGGRYLLLGQSYMPAQQFHVLRNTSSGGAAISPWFEEAALDRPAPAGLQTPEWRPFRRGDVRRF